MTTGAASEQSSPAAVCLLVNQSGDRTVETIYGLQEPSLAAAGRLMLNGRYVSNTPDLALVAISHMDKSLPAFTPENTYVVTGQAVRGYRDWLFTPGTELYDPNQVPELYRHVVDELIGFRERPPKRDPKLPLLQKKNTQPVDLEQIALMQQLMISSITNRDGIFGFSRHYLLTSYDEAGNYIPAEQNSRDPNPKMMIAEAEAKRHELFPDGIQAEPLRAQPLTRQALRRARFAQERRLEAGNVRSTGIQKKARQKPPKFD